METFKEFKNKYIFGIVHTSDEAMGGAEYNTNIQVRIGKKGENYNEIYEENLPEELEEKLINLGLEDYGENLYIIDKSEISVEGLMKKLIYIGLEYDSYFEECQQALED